MTTPTPEQRAEMAAFVDRTQPRLLDDLGIQRNPSSDHERQLAEKFGPTGLHPESECRQNCSGCVSPGKGGY